MKNLRVSLLWYHVVGTVRTNWMQIAIDDGFIPARQTTQPLPSLSWFHFRSMSGTLEVVASPQGLGILFYFPLKINDAAMKPSGSALRSRVAILFSLCSKFTNLAIIPTSNDGFIPPTRILELNITCRYISYIYLFTLEASDLNSTRDIATSPRT